MKIAVMSDSHGNFRVLDKIFSSYHADYYIHLGDGERELDRIAESYPDKQIIHVKGNCDFASFSPDDIFFEGTPDCRIFAVHGHKLNVKYSLETLKKKARQLGAKIALYGHTHERFCSYEDELYILNPGSCSCPRDGNKPSFAMIDISDAGVLINIIDL